MKLSIIIVSYKVKELLLACLGSLLDTLHGLECEIIVVDNNSADGTGDAVKEQYPKAYFIENKNNEGFAKANNQGYASSSGEYLLLLNPDTVVKPGAVRMVLDFVERTPDCGMAGCRLIYPDGRPQASIGTFPTIGRMLLMALKIERLAFPGFRHEGEDARDARPVDYVAGAFMMVRREAVRDEPYLLNPNFFMYAEEKDLALRLRKKGWLCYFVPQDEIVHFGGQSTDQQALANFLELHRSQVIYFCLHYQGIKRYLLIFLYGLFLSTTTLAAAFLLFTHNGKNRFVLFLTSAVRYPLMAFRACRYVATMDNARAR